MQLVGQSRDGGRFPIVVRIGVPVPAQRRPVWTCPLAVTPLAPKLTSIEGADALQALSLATSAAIRVLQVFVSQGGAVLHADGTPCPLETYFPLDPRT